MKVDLTRLVDFNGSVSFVRTVLRTTTVLQKIFSSVNNISISKQKEGCVPGREEALRENSFLYSIRHV